MIPPTLPILSSRVLPFDWQDTARDEIVQKLSNQRGALLRAGTGVGKMYIACASIRKLYLEGKLVNPKASINPFQVLWLTPKSVKAQTQQVVAQYGLTGVVHIMSYSELKASYGTMYITWIHDSVTGEDIPFWNLNTLVSLVKCDECQMLKNPESLQARVVRAIPETVKVLMASATPYQRVIDGTTLLECFGARTKYNTIPATRETSEKILAMIASPQSVDAYSPSATARLREELAAYTVELKNVRFKHKAITNCVDIHFKSAQERLAYDKLVQTLIANLQKRKGDSGGLSYIHILVEMQKMQQGAELLRVPHIAERVVDNLPTKAVVVASNFVDTLRGVYRELVNVHHIDKDRIAFIVGGQDESERQSMVNDFQRGKRDILLFTMRSGGVGISLHHDRETTKPRHIILPPTWSAIDLVQALGRVHRLTTISDTTQEILWYADTIETAVKLRVAIKIKCIAKSITAKEQFVDTFLDTIGEQVDSQELADIAEKAKHVPGEDQPDKDDLDSKDDDESITGEGLENN